MSLVLQRKHWHKENSYYKDWSLNAIEVLKGEQNVANTASSSYQNWAKYILVCTPTIDYSDFLFELEIF